MITHRTQMEYVETYNRLHGFRPAARYQKPGPRPTVERAQGLLDTVRKMYDDVARAIEPM